MRLFPTQGPPVSSTSDRDSKRMLAVDIKGQYQWVWTSAGRLAYIRATAVYSTRRSGSKR